jgi:hypothetical protein
MRGPIRSLKATRLGERAAPACSARSAPRQRVPRSPVAKPPTEARLVQRLAEDLLTDALQFTEGEGLWQVLERKVQAPHLVSQRHHGCIDHLVVVEGQRGVADGRVRGNPLDLLQALSGLRCNLFKPYQRPVDDG